MAKTEALSPEEFFSVAVMSNPDSIIVTLLEDGKFLQVNDAFLDLSGYRRDEVIGRTSMELGFWVEAEDRKSFLALLAREGSFRDRAVRFRVKNGAIRNCAMSAAIVRLGDRECATIVCRDVTARDEMVDRMEKSRFFLERAEEMADIGSWEFDFLSGKVTASPGACRIYGIIEDAFTIEAVEKVPLPEYRANLDEAREALIKYGVPYDIEFVIERGGDRAVRVIHSKARWDSVNHRLFGIIRDITEERETAAGLKQAIAEKETLIKELYHRTKNNMQIITSLLGIEGDRSSDLRVRYVFEEVQRRIEAMALVHEMLYLSNDLSRIDLKDFIPALAELLKSSLGGRNGQIDFAYEINEVALLIDAAVPCGIILNELISNALIHAFPGERSGTITLRARRENEGTVLIEVKDDGVGVPTAFDYREGGVSMGLSLVTSIVRYQLKGTVDIETGGSGFGCTLRFTDASYQARV